MRAFMRIAKLGPNALIFFDFLIYAVFADYADTLGQPERDVKK